MSSNNEVHSPVPARAESLHRPTWARDFAFVGGVSSFLAPFLIAGTALGWSTLLATSATGALSGALLGALLQGPLRRRDNEVEGAHAGAGGQPLGPSAGGSGQPLGPSAGGSGQPFGPSAGGLATAPWPLLVLLFLAVGAFWGAIVGAVGATVLSYDAGGLWGSPRGALGQVYSFFMGFAAVAAAAQLAWFGVAYARMDRARIPTWPLLVAACGTPFLGWAGLQVVSFGMWFGGDGMR